MQKLLLPFCLFLLCALSCKRKSAEPGIAAGLPGEVLVLAHEADIKIVEEMISHNQVNDPILLIPEYKGQVSFEPAMAFYYARHQSYEGTEKLAPLVLLVETEDREAGDYSDDLDAAKAVSEKANFTVYKDVWAKPQTVIRLRSKSIESALKTELKNIVAILREAEEQQGFTGSMLPNMYSDSVASQIVANYHFRIDLPPMFRMAQANQELVWLAQETNAFYRHVFINIFSDSVPVTTMEQAIENRNLYTKKYLSNPEKTDVVVSKADNYPKTWEKTNLKGWDDVQVLRGWYTEEGTYRRGPFQRWYLHDKARQRYVVLDGFVHAPDQPKLSFYRAFDIMAHSLKSE